jgi:hypothetical protein
VPTKPITTCLNCSNALTIRDSGAVGPALEGFAGVGWDGEYAVRGALLKRLTSKRARLNHQKKVGAISVVAQQAQRPLACGRNLSRSESVERSSREEVDDRDTDRIGARIPDGYRVGGLTRVSATDHEDGE